LWKLKEQSFQRLFQEEKVVALTISPADGFISRLLQQSQSTPAKATNTNSAPTPTDKQDQTSISQEARQASENSNGNLESKLIDLYNQKGNNVG